MNALISSDRLYISTQCDYFFKSFIGEKHWIVHERQRKR